MVKQDKKDMQKTPKDHQDVAYYDVKNGIYF
jgi:hypothetical protein